MMVRTGSLKTSVSSYHSALCNIPQQHRSHMTNWRCTGLGLVLHGPVQSDLVWHSLFWHFVCEFKM